MSRKGENIYKRKDGRWEGRYIKSRTIDGKAKYGYIYAKSYQDIKQKLAYARTGDTKANTIAVWNISFKYMANEWLLSIQPHIKESTNVKYSNLLQTYILPVFGDKTLNQLSNSYIQRFCNDLLISGGKNKKGLSPKTVTDILSILRSVLKFSSDKGANLSCDAKNITIKQTLPHMKVLSREEQSKLCEYLLIHSTSKDLGILICLFTGLRVGEICALKWKDISLSEKTIHVNKTMQRIQSKDMSNKKTKIIITQPKSSCSIRTIPMPDNIINTISFFQQSEDCYVLTGKETSFIEPRNMQHYFKRVLKQCAIDSCGFHSLRHTFATRCIEVGFDVKTLSEILGHSSVNITMNRYVHPSMDLKRENMNLLSPLISVK